jgi:hypothetical protein
MKALKIFVVVTALIVGLGGTLDIADAVGCGQLGQGSCGVAAHPSTQSFRGLIAITGHPGVLDTAAHSGTKPGCADCSWQLVVECAPNSPDAAQRLCIQAACRNGTEERIYLTTDAVTDEMVGEVCLRAGEHVVAVGDDAAARVGDWLKDARPPPMTIATKPKLQTLAGLPTLFSAGNPAAPPVALAGAGITETVTIGPARATWAFGDGASLGPVAADATVQHTYARGLTAHGTLTTVWGATYTIRYAGVTAGPYTAAGTLTRTQAFVLPVDTSSPDLVSH